MGDGHPARSDFDTLFVDHRRRRAGRTVLRTHTSPVQIRTMLAGPPPIYIVAPGPGVPARHARRHAHAGVPPDRGPRRRPRHHAGRPRRHDRGVHQGVLRRRLHVAAAAELLPLHRAVRRVRHPHARLATWLELGGCGMVHPNVLRAGGIDPEEWSGFAFGFGIDRMAQRAPRRRRPARDVHRRHPLRRSSSDDEDPAVLAARVRRLGEPIDLDALADTLAMLGLPVEERRSSTGGVAGVVTARVLRTEAPPGGGQGAAGVGRRRRRRASATSGAARSTSRPATSCRSHRSARRCPTAARSPAAASSASTPRGCSARPRELEPRRRPHRHPRAAAGRAARRAVRRGARLGATTSSSTSTSRATGRTAGRTSASPATWPPSSACRSAARPPPALVADRRRALTATVDIVDGDRCGRFTSTVLSGVRRRPVGAVDGRAAHRGGDAPDQQRRRRQQLRDARARPAEPRLRPRRRSAGDGFRIRTARAGETLTTLDGVERTLDRRRSADLRRRGPTDRHRRDHGRRRHRDQRIDDDRRAGDGVVRARRRSARSVARLGAALRGVGTASSGASIRTCIDTAIARFVELLGETCPDLVVHAGAVDAPRRVAAAAASARARCGCRGQPHPRHDARRRRPARPARPDRLHRVRRRATSRDRRHPVVAARQRRGDRRHRGGRPPVRLRPRRQGAADVDRRTGGSRVAQQRRRQLRRGAARARDHRGDAEPVPRPRHARPRRARRRRAADHQPAGRPRRACCGRRCGPGLLRAVAFNESHRRSGVRAVRDRPRLPAGSGRAARRVRGARRRARRRGGAGGRRGVARARRGAGRRRARSTRRRAGRPPRRRVRRRSSPGATRSVRSARSPRRCSRRSASPSGSPCSSSICAPCSATSRSRPQWKPTSRFPSSDLDLAFVSPDDVPAERLEKAIRQGAGALLVDLELFDVYRGGSLGDGRRSLAYRLRLQAADRSLTDADVAEVRQRVTAAAAKLGAELREPDGGQLARRLPGWLWVVVPMALSALLVGGIAVAVRAAVDDDGESIAGPAGELPAVVGAAEELLGTVPPPTRSPPSSARRYGEVPSALGDVDDELAFAAESTACRTPRPGWSAARWARSRSSCRRRRSTAHGSDERPRPRTSSSPSTGTGDRQASRPRRIGARPGARRCCRSPCRTSSGRRDRRHVRRRRSRRAGHAHRHRRVGRAGQVGR